MPKNCTYLHYVQDFLKETYCNFYDEILKKKNWFEFVKCVQENPLLSHFSLEISILFLKRADVETRNTRVLV